MTKQPWDNDDQLVALYLAKRGSADTEIESAFLKFSGHTRKSLNMAISNFRHLLGGKGLSNVSARQRRIAKEFGSLPISELRIKVDEALTASPSAPIPDMIAPAPAIESVSGTSSGRRLSDSELETARKILALVRDEISRVASNDESLLWALRRKVYKELIYDERSKPMARRWLKAKLFARQKGLCPGCNQNLPERYSVLDRREAMKGYSESNCRLVCPACDRKTQEARRYA